MSLAAQLRQLIKQCNMTDAQLADIGVNRSRFPLEVMQQIEADFAKKDMETQARQNSNVSINPNLSGAI